MRSRESLFTTLIATLLFTALTACSDEPIVPDISAREVGVVVTSTDVALTLFDVDDPTSTETVGLGADGSPVSLALRGRYAAVPLGVVPAVAIVDVREGVLLRTIGLAEGSGASGAAFVNDSIVLVTNPNLDSVTPVNILAGTTGEEIAVGRFPQDVAVVGGRAYVLNAELENFQPAGPSTITVLDGISLDVLETIELSGQNAAAAAVGPNGRLHVIQSGSWGADNGALSVVDLGTNEEVGFFEGFGNFPGSIAVGENGFAHVGVFGVGMLVWDGLTQTFVHGPDDAATPGGVASTSGIGFDGDGRLYALVPDCQDPSVAHRLDAAFASELAIPVGICPFAIGFTEVENTP
jgi:hypothetical protein